MENRNRRIAVGRTSRYYVVVLVKRTFSSLCPPAPAEQPCAAAQSGTHLVLPYVVVSSRSGDREDEGARGEPRREKRERSQTGDTASSIPRSRVVVASLSRGFLLQYIHDSSYCIFNLSL